MDKEKKIRLHPEKGLNPHMTTCTGCGKDGQEIILLGVHDKKVECPDCGAMNYGSTRHKACGRCKGALLAGKETIIEDHERIPHGLCDKCQKEADAFVDIVRAGGIHVRCAACGMRGVMKAGVELSKLVRLDFDKREKAPGKYSKPNEEGGYLPVGLELDKANCPICTPENKKTCDA